MKKKMQDLHYRTLDPRHLGRPTHLLPAFSGQFREDMDELFRIGLNRRYGATYQVTEASMHPMDGSTPSERWRIYSNALGEIGCHIDRKLVMSVLSYRYGLHEGQASSALLSDTLPETATEERVAAMLSQQFVDKLAARIPSPGNARDKALSFVNVVPRPQAQWHLTLTIQESRQALTGCVTFTLDEAWMDRLLHIIAPKRDSTRSKYTSSISAHLHIKLVARLLQKDFSLGELLALSIGDVIPISLGATDVLIDDKRLFTATVAEHKGKLCLTSFKDME